MKGRDSKVFWCYTILRVGGLVRGFWKGDNYRSIDNTFPLKINELGERKGDFHEMEVGRICYFPLRGVLFRDHTG
jgi:hypothetical protein